MLVEIDVPSNVIWGQSSFEIYFNESKYLVHQLLAVAVVSCRQAVMAKPFGDVLGASGEY